MPDEFMWRANFGRSPEITEFRRRIAQSLLRAISEGRKEMPKKGALGIHCSLVEQSLAVERSLAGA